MLPDIAPEEILVIDDSEVNVISADRLGMANVKYSPDDETHATIQTLLGLC